MVNTHTAEAGEPALLSVPGYAYEDLTGATWPTSRRRPRPATLSQNEAARSRYPELGDFYLGWSSHDVVAADGRVATFLLVSVSEDYLDAGLLTGDDLVAVMAGGMAGGGATATTETISGEKVAYAEADGVHAYLWFHDSVITGAAGPDEGDVRAFVEAYLEAAHQ